MKPILNFNDSIQELEKVYSCASGTDKFIARTIPLMIKQNNAIIALLKDIKTKTKHPKRKLSEYQKFCRTYLLEGYSLSQIAKAWQNLKREKS